MKFTKDVFLGNGGNSSGGLKDKEELLTEINAIGEQLVNTSKEQVLANTIILIGDSITSQNIHDVNGMMGYSARGYFTWANVLLNHRFNVLGIKGIGGQTTAQILARLQTDVIENNLKPKWCLVFGGVNDIGQGVPYETIISNLLKMYSMLNDNGIKVIATTITPTTGANTTEKIKTLYKVNAWIKNYCFSNSGVVLCDWNGSLSNPATGLPIDNVMSDGIHPSIYGASIMGKVLSDSLKNLTPELDLLINSNFEENLITNGMLEGNTNGIATGWAVYNNVADATTPIASKVPRADLKNGEWQQFKLNNSNFGFGIHTDKIGIDWNIGETVYGQCEFETDNDWNSSTAFNLTIEFSGASPTGDLSSSSNQRTIFLRPEKGVLRTPSVKIPTGTTRILFRLNANGTGTLRVAKCQISKV